MVCASLEVLGYVEILGTLTADQYNAGAGYDQIDVHACTANDIRVSNVPTAVDDATADVNMFLILGTLRGLNTCVYCSILLDPTNKCLKQ
jgi:hypothetical protein